ncbi:MAG: hypothetical protein QOH86_2204 [Sphingomonadales bacterium]|jgi:hypothetical protein|nr:hypothetical protein [Sphingomonadales bacterium]
MNKLIAALLVSAFAAGPVLAASPLDGTWKADLASVKWPSKPDVYVIRDGTYTCRSCVPRVTIRADGAFHRVSGHPYYDEQAVKIVDARTVTFAQRKGGKAMGEATDTVSADGRSMTYTFRDTSSPNGKIVTGSGTEARIGHPIPGAHALSGSWRNTSMGDMTDAGLIVSMRTEGNVVHVSTPTGISYTARLGGAPAPINGDPAHTMAAMQRTNARTYVETDTRGGKVVQIITMTALPGGKAMHVAVVDRVQGTTWGYKALKQ